MLMGLDLALRSGWAIGDRTGTPIVGKFDLPGFSNGARAKSMGSIYAAVLSLVREHKIKGVAIEAPLHLGGKSAHTERSLAMLSGAAQAGAINGGAEKVWLVAPATWRKAVLGQGFPDHPKQAAVDYCKLVLKSDIPDHNMAEAACILVWAHGQAVLL